MSKSKSLELFVACLILFFISNASGQTGGDFTITQSVVASGGGQSSAGGTFSLDGTIGQAVAGNAASGSPFAVTSGFWNFNALAPTAATVTIGGRALTATGRGIRNVLIRLTDANGNVRIAYTTAFGYYRFAGVAAGETFIITAKGKRFEFSQPSRVLNVNEDDFDINFIANPN